MYADVYVEGDKGQLQNARSKRGAGAWVLINKGCELPSMSLANLIEASEYDERACPRSQRHKRVPAVDEPLH
jgi:hypothetical protein